MIDTHRLLELRDEIGSDILSDVADMFLGESDEVVAQLLQGQLCPAEMGERLHFLKGSALNLGLSALATLCQDGERRAFSGEARPVDGQHLRQTYDASKSAFLAATTLLQPAAGPG